jgi:hypothetical protein
MDWNLFYRLAENTAHKIIVSGFSPDFIVGIARGGWVLSRILCDFLGVKDLVSLKVEHWGITATPNGKAQLKYPFNIDLTNRRVLVVDDITDTGQSMIVATEYVESLNPEEIKTATLRHITGSEFTPDFYGDKITWRWVIFPWNYIEDLCNIIQKTLDNGVVRDEIKGRLLQDHNIQIDEEEISKILMEIKRRTKEINNPSNLCASD